MFEVMAELEAIYGRLAAMCMSDQAFAEPQDANAKCQSSVDRQDRDVCYAENERFHRIIYHQSGNGFLASEAGALNRRQKPFRRQQPRLRGRMAQSMAEHEAIVDALENADPDVAANALRGHASIQGEKFYSLMAHLNTATG